MSDWSGAELLEFKACIKVLKSFVDSHPILAWDPEESTKTLGDLMDDLLSNSATALNSLTNLKAAITALDGIFIA